MGTHRPPVVMPDMKRRRASTGERIATIMTLARRLPLTRQVLADQLADATPSQMEFMESWMNAEIESRERSKRSRLLKAAGFPADKELGGYDWTPIRFPVDYGRGQITTLDFIAGHDDLVLFGPPGTGKTHLAIALGRNACRKGIPARYFTAAGLVMRLLRAQSDNRLDRELAAIGRTPLLVIDELGYVPIDEDGSRLLFQVVTNAYETQSIIYTTNIEFSGWGRIFGDPQHGRRDHRPHRPPRTDDPLRGRILAQDPRPHAITNAITNNQQDRPTPKRPETRRSHGLKETPKRPTPT